MAFGQELETRNLLLTQENLGSRATLLPFALVPQCCYGFGFGLRSKKVSTLRLDALKAFNTAFSPKEAGAEHPPLCGAVRSPALREPIQIEIPGGRSAMNGDVLGVSPPETDGHSGYGKNCEMHVAQVPKTHRKGCPFCEHCQRET